MRSDGNGKCADCAFCEIGVIRCQVDYTQAPPDPSSVLRFARVCSEDNGGHKTWKLCLKIVQTK
ncbi:hypothetical protein GA0061101_13146 [Rhizobium lusitanum]|jgi:hypothetical protein|uniref:Uncharacterized protein n=1 Tax=Rhizobium lusitanum TaxID=293958 RepID=A0A1C3XBZ5_9HYPH|nr:hypothetical protein GA0061101_13146 [Rhizobium lusitanum]